ncbi:MAG: RagB/SusD family nutrient uptake outer membrane protein [Gemmatimonadota bacterium]|nr:MAG: RagB/SusD family nutrient uptake outer membrane protein [Gemmatimonadota bacterium]
MAKRASFSARARAAGPLLLGAVLLAACEFEVVNPGRVLEEDLNDIKAVEPLVVGMSSDFSTAIDDMTFLIARASDEMAGGGSYSSTAEFRVGIIENDYVDWEWESMGRARWVAEDGIRRMQEDIPEYQFEGNELTARAYLFLGLANRALGESFCDVVYDGGGPEAPSAAFQRAVDALIEALDHAQQAGASDIELAAYGGLAQAYVGLGNWTTAVNNANMVPTDFVYNAIYHNTSGREENINYFETHRRHEMSAYLTYADSVDPPDPRAPFTDCRLGGCPNEQGADGSTPHLRQEKYQDYGTEIPVVKGTEMRLIEAEAQLVQNGAAGIGAAIASINEVRTFWGLTLIDPTGMTEQDAWVTLDHERHLTLWIEGRRFFDIRRWDAAGLDYLPAVMWISGGTLVYQGENPRDVCIPVSESECLTNENVKETAACP